MARHEFGYFVREGVSNMFGHGFMSFAAIGVTIGCLLIMGTFSLVAYNAEEQLRVLEEENQIVAFVDDSLSRTQGEALAARIEALDNVSGCTFITREEAAAAYEERHADEPILQGLDATIFRDRYAVNVESIELIGETADKIEGIGGIAWVRVDEDIAQGFTALRNLAGVVCAALIAILFVVSVFIISNTIKLTTFNRREEIAIMKMVGATNGFIRWPFVYEGFLMGLISALGAFGLQWLLYTAVARSIEMSNVLRIITVVPFGQIWQPVAAVFVGAGMLIGIGGSLMAIRKFLHV